ncbi:Anaerobic sulfite reductase subunit A [Caloramator mitchellensis]|uniref:Anaerobic sulfite reductase subunit A n=1 Tax=Caloramator mitchellensis TaxID=908809 RepID=A0A0R3JTA5_CALMK|nr:anaerobic sulfite reductase subunit AsrA [Caloramator mitchellensis]KRQ86755.1 Anaerobic sulfite reductase subunit A [Caloramator mitchellensis]
MGIKISVEKFDSILNELKNEYKIYAPHTFAGLGAFSDTNSIRYAEIDSIKDVEYNKKSDFSFKEIVLPITQTLFYFTEDEWIEPKIVEKKILIFARSCDINAIRCLDEMYLRNGYVDPYYKALRDKVRFCLIECKNSFENCFCVSMEANKTDDYDLFIRLENEDVYIEVRNEEFNLFQGEEAVVEPVFVTENEVKVRVPEELDERIFNSRMWKEYSSRCIGCGRCNFVCPTCTCFTMQDIFYKDNKNAGERRRVWASCMVDGYTDMAGGHSFRQDKGDRMRFRVMHKVYDFKKRFGYHMCTGCGRCDDVCPEYISFSNCINKLNEAVKEVQE